MSIRDRLFWEEQAKKHGVAIGPKPTGYRIESCNGVTQAPYATRRAAQAAANRANRNAPGYGWHVVPESEYPR